MELCVEMRLCVGNTYLEHRSLHNYKRVEVKSMIDLVLVKKDMLLFVQGEEWDEDSQITMLCCGMSGWIGHALRPER